jgi:hypothetical protein
MGADTDGIATQPLPNPLSGRIMRCSCLWRSVARSPQGALAATPSARSVGELGGTGGSFGRLFCTPPVVVALSRRQYLAFPGVRGKGMASRTLAKPVT